MIRRVVLEVGDYNTNNMAIDRGFGKTIVAKKVSNDRESVNGNGFPDVSGSVLFYIRLPFLQNEPISTCTMRRGMVYI